jgi:hypothetical protein
MKRPPLIGAALLASSMACAQATDTTVRAAFKVIFNFDARRTFVDGRGVRFYGFRLGAERGMDVISLGLYGLGDTYVRQGTDPETGEVRDLVTEFDYAGIGYERLLVNEGRWQVGLPVVLGLGNYRTRYTDAEGRVRTWSSNELVPVDLCAQADYDLFWWVFIGTGAGYRYVFAADREVSSALSDWTWYFKVGLRMGRIINRTRDLFRHDGPQ